VKYERYPKKAGPYGKQENVEDDRDGDPYRNSIQNTQERKGTGSRTPESWQPNKTIHEKGQEKPGTRVVTTYKGEVVSVRN
jgi:hypothetical protein